MNNSEEVGGGIYRRTTGFEIDGGKGSHGGFSQEYGQSEQPDA